MLSVLVTGPWTSPHPILLFRFFFCEVRGLDSVNFMVLTIPTASQGLNLVTHILGNKVPKINA